jgi:hypothetical protein
MAKLKQKKKPLLPKPEEVPTVKPRFETLACCKARLAKAKAAATKDGKFNKYEPKYRAALKALKRAQRVLYKELFRRRVKKVPKAAAPAEAPKAEAPKVEAPKAEAPKAEAPKAEAPKAEAPKAETPKAEAPKAEVPAAEAPKEGEKK